MTQLEQFIKDKKEESEKKSPKLDVIKRIAYFQKLVEDFYSKVEKDWLADVWNEGGSGGQGQGDRYLDPYII